MTASGSTAKQGVAKWGYYERARTTGRALLQRFWRTPEFGPGGKRWPDSWPAQNVRLVSYRLCPFVQQVAIALELKEVKYHVDYVDLTAPPDWFRAVSPSGKVPLLRIGSETLFESTAISEYIDATYPPRLHPRDALALANERAWMALGDQALWDVFELSVVEDAQSFDETLARLHRRLARIETRTAAAPFFRGPGFGLVDATWAPLLQRLEFLHTLHPGVLVRAQHPRTLAWKDALLEHPAVKRSSVPYLEDIYRKQLIKRGGYVAAALPSATKNDTPGARVY